MKKNYRLRKKYQRNFTKLVRKYNKAIEDDDLWQGRFVCRQIYSRWENFDDGSGGILYTVVRCVDKQTRHDLLGHDKGESALGQSRRDRRGNRGGLPDCLRRRIHKEFPRRIRHLHRAGRNQRLGRSEAAALHSAGAAPLTQDTYPRRQHVGGGHTHRRCDPPRIQGLYSRNHKDHHRPARLLG